jgi:hypothetical protein
MSTETENPLKKFYRQPQLYIKLPSNGQWWPEGSLQRAVTGEYPVLAMTAKDELCMKTPDALLNGQSTVDVIQSCIPNIKDAWHTPICDIDLLLIAIRLATYGNRMEFTSICPHCNHKNENAIDLQFLIEKFQTVPKYHKIMKIDDLEICLKAESYQSFNKKSMAMFEEQRILQLVSQDTLPEEEKFDRFKTLFNKLLSLTVEQISGNIAYIKLNEGTVVENPLFINEFFQNCDRKVWNTIKDAIEDIVKENPTNKIDIKCESCTKDYQSPLTFEMSNFFA